MQIVGREAASLIVQIMHRGLKGHLSWMHVGFCGHAPTLFQIAGRTSGDDVFPCRLTAKSAGDQMIKCQIIGSAAILAFKPVAQENIKACESRIKSRLNILFQADDAWQLHA